MIDLHTHVLPGLDDGAATLEVSVAMARMAAADGVEVLVATPHIREDYDVRIDELPERIAALNAELKRCEIELLAVQGGEVSMTLALELSDEELRAVSLGGSRYLLLESPYGSVPPGFAERVCGELLRRGFTPVLGHPERNVSFAGDLDRLEGLVRFGVLCQITASSLTGEFGRPVKKASEACLRRGLVQSIASDSHGPEQRAPVLSPARAAAIALLGDEGYARALVDDVPARILANEPVDGGQWLRAPDDKERPRRRWRGR